MNQTSPQNVQSDDLRSAPVEDKLDRALADFFKSKMKEPWPKAPATTARASEPSVLVASRAANATVELPRNQPVAAGQTRGGGNRSRYTLAVSVAALLGTCWLLSNGFQPGQRVGPSGNDTPKIDVFTPAGANGPAALKELQKDKAENGNQGVAQPKVPWDWQQVK
jgi:hypothetical protein